MYSVLDEILKLRNGKQITVDCKNSNRYQLLIKETDGTKTAYCFSSPIYNDKTKKLIDMRFHEKNNTLVYDGSNTYVKISDRITLENEYGLCSISLHEEIDSFTDKLVSIGKDTISPSLNGILYKAYCGNGILPKFELEVSNQFLDERSNNKYFALMIEAFKPFVTVSCAKGIDNNGKIIPVIIEYNKISGKKYEFVIRPTSDFCSYVFFEINLYEGKLFQDTTVESNNFDMNNSFGSSAFIGKTPEFGEQWLYTRLDLSKISNLVNKNIISVNFHLPKYARDYNSLKTFKVSSRFCSFGSTWENKIEEADFFSESKNSDFFHSIDITSLLTDKKTRHLIQSEGFIIKSCMKNGASVVSTGDSCFAPQILEVSFR